VLAAAIFASYGIISLQELSLTSVYLSLAPKAGAAILILLAGKAIIELTSPLVDRVTRRHEIRESARRIWAWMVWGAVAFLAIASFAGDLSSVLIAFGLLALAISLAFRRPILSVVGWLNITSRRLYSRGDVIESGQLSGEVSDIGLLTTSIWDFKAASKGETGRTISIPNSLVFEQPLAVHKRSEHHIWDEVSISLPLGADYRKARTALLKACDEAIGIKKMAGNASEQQSRLKASGLWSKVPAEPEVFMILEGSTIQLRLRYLIDPLHRAEAKSAISEHALLLLSKDKVKLES